MDLADSPEEAAFRARVRAWLAEVLPTLPWPEPSGLAAKLPFWRQWQRLLFEAGFAGISWPREYGGYGADAKIRSSAEAKRAGYRPNLSDTATAGARAATVSSCRDPSSPTTAVSYSGSVWSFTTSVPPGPGRSCQRVQMSLKRPLTGRNAS